MTANNSFVNLIIPILNYLISCWSYWNLSSVTLHFFSLMTLLYSYELDGYFQGPILTIAIYQRNLERFLWFSESDDFPEDYFN